MKPGKSEIRSSQRGSDAAHLWRRGQVLSWCFRASDIDVGGRGDDQVQKRSDNLDVVDDRPIRHPGKAAPAGCAAKESILILATQHRHERARAVDEVTERLFTHCFSAARGHVVVFHLWCRLLRKAVPGEKQMIIGSG